MCNNCSHDIALRDYGMMCSPVVINAVGTEIGVNYVGMVQITVADDLITGFSSLKLAFFGKRHGFRLISEEPQIAGGVESFMDDIKLPDKPIIWKLPVLEFAIVPFLVTENADEQQGGI